MVPFAIRRACSSRRSSSFRSLFSVVIGFRLVVELGYLTGALPEFYIMAVNKLFRLFHSHGIVGALERNRAVEMAI